MPQREETRSLRQQSHQKALLALAGISGGLSLCHYPVTCIDTVILPSFSLCIPTGCPTCLPTSGGGDVAAISQVTLDRFRRFFIAFYRSYRDAYFEPLTAPNRPLVISDSRLCHRRCRQHPDLLRTR